MRKSGNMIRNATPLSHPRLALRAALFFVLFCLFAGAAMGGGSLERDPREHFFTQTFGDMPEELELARKEGKKGILFFFEAEACPYCRAMLRRVFNQANVQDWYREHFLNIAIDIHGDVEIRDFDGITLPSKVFSDQRRVVMTPLVSFIDLQGVEVYRHLGMVKSPEEFLLLGEYIVGGHYFDTEYNAFARSKGMAGDEQILVTPAVETIEQ